MKQYGEKKQKNKPKRTRRKAFEKGNRLKGGKRWDTTEKKNTHEKAEKKKKN